MGSELTGEVEDVTDVTGVTDVTDLHGIEGVEHIDHVDHVDGFGAAEGSDDIADDILERIRDDGGRVTASRRVIVEAMLDGASHHLTAHDIVDAVRRRDPEFHRSTVYRTLDRLTELGVVDRMQIGTGPAVYHLSHRPHHHLVCDRCGSVQEAPGDVLDAVAARLASDPGFVLNPAATPLHGLCPSCAT